MEELSLVKIRLAREKAGYSQAQCAEAIGVKRPEYNKKEKGGSIFSVPQLEKLCKFLQVSVSELFDDINHNSQTKHKKEGGDMLNSYKEIAEHYKSIVQQQGARINQLEKDLLHCNLQQNNFDLRNGTKNP